MLLTVENVKKEIIFPRQDLTLEFNCQHNHLQLLLLSYPVNPAYRAMRLKLARGHGVTWRLNVAGTLSEEDRENNYIIVLTVISALYCFVYRVT